MSFLADTHDSSYAQGGYWYDVDVKLPAGVTCDRCVLQWRYHGGNNWGCDAPGDCGMGKGKFSCFSFLLVIPYTIDT